VEKELLNLVGLTDSAWQFKWNYMISERAERLNDLPPLLTSPRAHALMSVSRLIYIGARRLQLAPDELEKLARHHGGD